MWICDAGQLYDSISDNWCGIGIADVSEILEFVKYAPTIDPETLPLVRQLREELARVTAERDAAVEQLRGTCYACKYYTAYHNDGLKHEKACINQLVAVDRWKWRGPQTEE